VNTRKNPSITQKIPITRLFCECELYAPANYDSDPEMKKVMEIFNKQTQQRFEEYDERIKTTRQKCKDQCDKDIKKIILRDKIEKKLTEKLGVLQTDITTEDIPTCFCEKSVADKTEKVCLQCGYGLGSVAPSVGLIGSLSVNVWKTGAFLAAAEKGTEAGIEAAIQGIKTEFVLNKLGGVGLEKLFTAKTFNKNTFFVQKILEEYYTMCKNGTVQDSIFDLFVTKYPDKEHMVIKSITASANNIALKAGNAAKTTEAAEIALANTASYNLYLSIAYSVIAIVVIVFVMFIIYLILRYRRKKKMKKKLQYIKLLEE
ncbi:hypothetical protein PFMALIP_00641, partial [Plasmodium falciparum MaliPS096_E11]